MTSKELLEAAMSLDSKYLDEADARTAAAVPRSLRRIRMIAAATAAAACLAVAVGLRIFALRDSDFTVQNSTPDHQVTEITGTETTAPHKETETFTTTAATTTKPTGTQKTDTTAKTDSGTQETDITTDAGSIPNSQHSGTTAAQTQTAPVTDTTKADDSQSGQPKFNFCVDVYDFDAGMSIENVDVQLEKRFWYQNEEGITVYTGEIEVLETWNTTDNLRYITQEYTWTPEKPFDIWAVVYDLPEGYAALGDTIGYVKFTQLGRTPRYGTSRSISLRRKDRFPITGTYWESLMIKDVQTAELIPDLDCVLVNMTTGEELMTWNTSEQPIIHLTGLEYCYEDYRMEDKIRYAVKFLNLPDNYVVQDTGSQELAYLLYDNLPYYNSDGSHKDVYFTLRMLPVDSD